MNSENFELYLRHPFTMTLCGPTGCGKTTFVRRLVENAPTICDPSPERILYVYSIWQPMYDEMRSMGVEFVQGIQENFMNQFSGDYPAWVILDDVMQDAVNSRMVSEMFTQDSHHRSVSIIFLKQNLFKKGKNSTDISRNEHYVVLFRTLRDIQPIEIFARQAYARKSKKFLEAYEKATEDPHSYVFMDFTQKAPKNRIYTHIFGEGPITGVIGCIEL